MKKKLFSIFLCMVMVLSLAACGGEEPSEPSAADSGNESPGSSTTDDGDDSFVTDEPDTSVPDDPVSVEDGSWAVYWYLCGSDLESKHGCASTDLSEMMEVELPENVTVVIQTGGASVWQNDYADPGRLQRWVYNSDGLTLVAESESASMGDAQTLYEFLEFASTNYPADKVAVTFWNHGGGSVDGAAFDELYGMDSLDLTEMYQAFNEVWPADTEAPALELVGFDTCLMATVDVAAVFQNFSKYLVASEEVEPGNGWLYSGWLAELAQNPEMNGDDLGIAICNSFYEGCEAVGTEEETTLSVTDLTRLTPLLEAYEAFGQEAFAAAAEDPAFFAQLGRAAAQSENYGGNTREQGYTNMVDLGHLARQTAWMLPSAQGVCDALEDCVIYQVGGPYRAEATGLSCFYSYNGDVDNYNGYAAVGTGMAFKYLYAYGLTGELGEGGEEYLASLDIQELPDVVTLASVGWDGAPLDVNDEGAAVLTLGPEANNILAGIGFSLFYVDEENDQMMLLGTDNDIDADWENGVFYDNFRGVWGAIDGHTVYMELSFEGEDYNLYSVPILLNGEEYNLQVVYDFTSETWSVLGAAPGIDESGMAAKELRLLEEGDVITTIWQLASYSGDDDFEAYAAEELTVTADTSFGEASLPDGQYAMVFEMRDAAGSSVYSDAVTFDCADGEIYTSVNVY